MPRWREDIHRTITVRIDNATTLPGWTLAYRQEVLFALGAWEGARSPAKFALVTGDDHADVTVHWIGKFDARYEGWTTVSWNGAGWLTHGDVTLALHSPSGQLLTSGERTQVAMHEVGHVLGLSHSSSMRSIMSPTVRVTTIGPSDITSLHALYEPSDSSEFAQSLVQRSAAAGDRCTARET